MTITPIPIYHLPDLEQQVSALLQENIALAAMSPAQRIDYFSRRFLEHPYMSGALGEGEHGLFDQGPPFRFDAFDCLTYVNTVLALALSHDVREFRQCMLRLNYYDAEPNYLKRYHFMSLDWNVQNQNAGILKDITKTILGNNHQPLFQQATAQINKAAWLQHRKVTDLKLLPGCEADMAQLLQTLHHAAEQFHAQTVSINYISLTDFLDQEQCVASQIPHAAIVEIVRPGWDLSASIGTKLHVSHLGFAVRVDDRLLFRHASSEEACVVEVPLHDYFYQRINSPTIKGFNVHVLHQAQ